MIDHTGVAATNYAKSKQFYTQALAPLGYQLMMELPKEVTKGRRRRRLRRAAQARLLAP